MESVLGTLQREVQRKLGCCMLRLQQYEVQMKSMVAFATTLDGKLEGFGAARRKQKRRIRKKTLGTLMKKFIGEHLTDEETELETIDAKIGADAFGIRIRFAFQMQPEALAQVESDLNTLISLRNVLVHHLVERFDMTSEAGCSAAIAHLDARYETIEKNLDRLRLWATCLDEARAMMVSAMETEEFEKLLFQPSASPSK